MGEPVANFATKTRVPASPGYGYFGISWYEFDEAATSAGYKWEDFIELPPNLISRAVAKHRLKCKLQALIRDFTEQQAIMRRKQQEAAAKASRGR